MNGRQLPFPFQHELPEERAGRHELMKTLSRRYEKTNEQDLRQAVARSAKKVRTRRGIARTHRLLAALYDLYFFYVVKAMLARRLRGYRRKSKIRLKGTTHLIAALIRAEYPVSDDTELEWVRAVRHATIQRIPPDDLPQYLKVHGGIGRASEKFNVLLNPRKGKAATLVRPQSGQVPIAATPSFRTRLRRHARSHPTKHFVTVVGRFAGGRLTLKFLASGIG